MVTIGLVIFKKFKTQIVNGRESTPDNGRTPRYIYIYFFFKGGGVEENGVEVILGHLHERMLCVGVRRRPSSVNIF